MLHKTKGIVLKTIKYSDSSIITKIYTEKFGLQTYIVNGVRSAKAKGKASLYQHGNMLDLVIYYKDTGGIMRISEAKMEIVFRELPYTIQKSALLLFCIEVLNKVVKEEEANPALFSFLEKSFLFLDTTEQAVYNFHIAFLVLLSKHLGFSPAADTGKYFNLGEGLFENSIPADSNYMEPDTTAHLKKFLPLSLDQSHCVAMDAAERKLLLQQLIAYYKIHIAGFGEMHSPEILSTVMR